MSLFIGGPLDGTVIQVPAHLPTYRVVKRQPFRRIDLSAEDIRAEELPVIEYRRYKVPGDTEFFTCLTLDEAVKKLLAAYPRAE